MERSSFEAQSKLEPVDCRQKNRIGIFFSSSSRRHESLTAAERPRPPGAPRPRESFIEPLAVLLGNAQKVVWKQDRNSRCRLGVSLNQPIPELAS